MRTVVFRGNSHVGVQEIPIPRPSPGEVLLRVRATAICGSELHAFRAAEGAAGEPWNAGHEVAAEVAEANQTDLFQKGDRVVVNIMAASSCGRCFYCLSGDPKYCSDRTPLWGAHREYVTVGATACYPLPADIPFETGVLLGGDFVGTGYRAIKRLGVTALDTVLVLGAGPVGLGVVSILRFHGVRVLVSEPSAYRRDLCVGLGATAFDPTSTDVIAAVAELTAGLGPHEVIDCAGRPDTQNLALDAVRVKGKVGFVGENSQLTINPSRQIIHKELTVVGSVYFTAADYAEILTLYRQGYRPERLATHRFPITDADRAYRTFVSGNSGKVLFVYGDD